MLHGLIVSVGADARGRLDAAEACLTEASVAAEPVPADRLEAHEKVGHVAANDLRHGAVAIGDAVCLGESLTAHDVRAVHVNRCAGTGRRTRAVRGVREHLGAGGFDEADRLKRADLALVEGHRVGVLDRATEASRIGCRTEVERHVRVDVADVRTVEGCDIGCTELGHDLANVVRGDRVVAADRCTARRVACATRCVHDVRAAGENFTDNLVDRVASVVTDDVRSSSVNVEERRATELGRGDDSVAVFSEGDGDLRVAQSGRGNVGDLVEGAGGSRDVRENRERDGRTRHGLLGRLHIGSLVEQKFRTQSEVRKAIKCCLVNRK